MSPFAVIGVWRDGVPVELERHDSLADALRERDALNATKTDVAPYYGVVDRDDEERGWLDWCEECGGSGFEGTPKERAAVRRWIGPGDPSLNEPCHSCGGVAA